jgi:hypothetical protein
MGQQSPTPTRVGYALRRAGVNIARTRATRCSGVVIKEDGPSVVIRYYDAHRFPDPARAKRSLDRVGATLRKRGYSVTTVPEEAALRVM